MEPSEEMSEATVPNFQIDVLDITIPIIHLDALEEAEKISLKKCER